VDVRLRELRDADLDQQFVWEQDPEAIAMAAFTRADPSDREAFDRHHARIREDPECNLLAIEDDDGFAGTIGSYAMHGEREVTYWLDRARWGRGIASAALGEFLRVERTRPLYAGCAAHNVGSATVLERAGFVRVGEDRGYAGGLGREVVELRFRLDR
jgi:RimJ/RimL family protein N-acetyltransferase